MAGSFSSPLVSSSSSSSSTVITITRAKAAVKGEAPDGGGPAPRRTGMSGIPVAPQQKAYKVGPVGEPRPDPRPPASCIFAEPLISLVIFKTEPQARNPRSPRRSSFEAAAGHCEIPAHACLNLQKLVLHFLALVKTG